MIDRGRRQSGMTVRFAPRRNVPLYNDRGRGGTARRVGSASFDTKFKPGRSNKLLGRPPPKGRGKGFKRAPPADLEPSLEETPMKGGGVLGPIAKLATEEHDNSKKGWELRLNDVHRRSFVSFLRKPFKPELLDEWLEKLDDDIKWKQPVVGAEGKRMPRKAAWLTGSGCTCPYAYGAASFDSLDMEPWFVEITKQVCEQCGIKDWPDSCNANLYEDGSHSVGFHADDEPLFNSVRNDALVVSLSLGATRSFDLRPNDEPEEVTRLSLAHGDICTMEGLTQKHYKHRVPAERNVSQARINLTWRWIAVHAKGCKMHDGDASPPQLPPGKPVAGVLPARSSAPREAPAPMSKEEVERRRKREERFGGATATAERAMASLSKATADPQTAVSATPEAAPVSAEAAEAKRKRMERFADSADAPVSTEAPAKKRRREDRVAAKGTEKPAPAAQPVGESAEMAEKRKVREKRFEGTFGSAIREAVGTKDAPVGTEKKQSQTKESRAKRFGTADAVADAPAVPAGETDEAKQIRERAARFTGPSVPNKTETSSEAERRKLREDRFK